MKAGIAFGLLVLGCPALFVAAPVASGRDKSRSPEVEYKAVTFGTDEKEATKKLNELAAEGWEYVGPLGNSLVAFKRSRASTAQLAAKNELARWEGDWAGSDGSWLKVKGDRWATGFNEVTAYSGRLKIVAIQDKRTLVDMEVEEGETKGQTVKAIFRLEGDTLHYCGTYVLPRPTEFVKGEGGDPWSVAFKREKK